MKPTDNGRALDEGCWTRAMAGFALWLWARAMAEVIVIAIARVIVIARAIVIAKAIYTK